MTKLTGLTIELGEDDVPFIGAPRELSPAEIEFIKGWLRAVQASSPAMRVRKMK